MLVSNLLYLGNVFTLHELQELKKDNKLSYKLSTHTVDLLDPFRQTSGDELLPTCMKYGFQVYVYLGCEEGKKQAEVKLKLR